MSFARWTPHFDSSCPSNGSLTGHDTGDALKFPREVMGDVTRVHAGLRERANRGKGSGPAVESCHERLADQNGHDVAPVLALGGWRVDLDAVPEAEQSLGAVPLPQQGVERRQDRPGIDSVGGPAAG